MFDFSDNSEKLLTLIDNNRLNIEALNDLDILELFWATKLFPIFSQKARSRSGYPVVLRDEDAWRQSADDF